MNDRKWKPRKVVVVGAGDVGSTFAYSLAQSGLADEIVMIDHNRDLLNGQVLDLAHGFTFFPTVNIYAGEISDYTDAHIIVIAAGSKQRPDESRINLLKRNAVIMEQIVGDIVDQNSQGVIVVVSNPVDILTYVALRRSGWDRGRVIGSGTVLDSARFRYLLSRHCRVDVHNVHAYILGEHGDSEFAAWSLTHIAGMAIDEYCPLCCRCNDWNQERGEIVKEVRDSAYHIINYKGATYYAIGLALVQIVRAILRNQRSVLTVSTLLDGEHGLNDVCLSVPGLVTQNGVEYIMECALSPEELESLSNSSSILRRAIAEMKQT
jgi:L-lactate dehydrogenase